MSTRTRRIAIFSMYAIDSQTQGYASSVPITTSCSGQSSLTRSRNQPARSAAPFDKTRAGSLHVQPNLRASSVPGSLLCVVLNLRDSSRRSGYCPFCPSGCFLLLTSRAYRASQVVRNVTAELRPNVETEVLAVRLGGSTSRPAPLTGAVGRVGASVLSAARTTAQPTYVPLACDPQ